MRHVWTSFLNLRSPQPEGISDHRNGGKAHGGRGNDRAEENAEVGIKDTRCDGHAESVIDKGKKQVLLDIGHSGAAQTSGTDDPGEVALDQGDTGTFHSYISARSHRDPHFRLGQGGGIIDTVTG